MIKTIILTVLSLLLFWNFNSSVFAQYYSNMYSRSTLELASEKYSRNLHGIWREDLKGRLLARERRAAANVNMVLPAIGLHRHPLDFYADSRSRRVTIPIMSVKFFDDICTALGWMEKNGCNKLLVSDYVGMIRYQNNSAFPGNRYPAPLSALGVPRNALDDPFVYDVSGKALKSGIYFLMAHELAHVIYGHQGYDGISANQAQRQEIEADNFALNLMRRISVPPVGIAFFFMIASRFESAPGDFGSISAYESYLRERATHPLTSARLISISDYILDNAHDFTRGQQQSSLWYSRIISLSKDIRNIGLTLDDRNIREFQRMRSIEITPNDLRNACQ